MADRPLAAHAEAGDDARGDERAEPRGQSAEHRARAVGENRPLEDRLPSMAVRERAEEHAACRGGAERYAHHERMRVAPEAEVGRDGGEQEGVEAQVVEVEEPARPGEREHPVMDGRRARGFAEERQGAERSGRRAVSTSARRPL